MERNELQLCTVLYWQIRNNIQYRNLRRSFKITSACTCSFRKDCHCVGNFTCVNISSIWSYLLFVTFKTPI